jgi:hypothetical protein
MMGRANLGALLGNVEDKPADGKGEASSSETPATEDSRSIVIKERRSIAAAKPEPAKVITEPTPYLEFARKETRLREDQQNLLTQHARRLNRAKATGTPRITDNTLIRVAVDLLLARIDSATGDDEAAILKSLEL